MALVNEAGARARFEHAAIWVTQELFGPINFSRQSILVRSGTGTLLKGFGETIQADAGQGSQRDIAFQVLFDVFTNTIQARLGRTTFIVFQLGCEYPVSLGKVSAKSVAERFAVQ